MHANAGETSFEFLGRTLTSDGWTIDLLEDGRTFRAVFDGKNDRFWIHARIPTDLDVLLCYSRCPLDVPPELLKPAAELITRINFGLRVGNFEIDLGDGEIRFKSSFDFRDIELTDSIIKNVLLPCAYTMDQYLPTLEALTTGGKSVSEALSLVEG